METQGTVIQITPLAGAATEKRKRQRKGNGRIYQRGRVTWIQYNWMGRTYRESSGSVVKQVAVNLLQTRLAELRVGIVNEPRKSEKVTYDDMRGAFYASYGSKKKKSVRVRVKEDGSRESYVCGVPELDEFFGSRPGTPGKPGRPSFLAAQITEDKITEFIQKRQQEGAANGTVNRSLTALRRMFRLCSKKVRTSPDFRLLMLKEPNGRKGFLEWGEFTQLRQALPEDLRPVLTIAYHTGMRHGEIKNLRWENINLMDGELRLELGTTKNDEAREIPLPSDLVEMLRILKAKRPDARKDDFAFRRNGRPLGTFRKAWIRATVAAGLGEWKWFCGRPLCKEVVRTAVEADKEAPACPKCGDALKVRKRYLGKLFHDLRRSGVRNLVRAGVPEDVAMRISGHKTRSVFSRYNITSKRDLYEAKRKLESYHKAEQANIMHSSGTIAANPASEHTSERPN